MIAKIGEKEYCLDGYTNIYLLPKLVKEIYQQGRADADTEYKLLLNELERMEIEWVCDDLVGEFIDENDDSWCETHCDSICGAKIECFKKWCEWKREQIGEKNE